MTSNGNAKFSFFFREEIVTRFGYSEDSGKIETVPFLEASRNVVAFIESMGKVFIPLKQDINGNITKITKKYMENEPMYKYVDDMILDEKKQGKDEATDALQWLRRALHFLARFFQLIVEDVEKEHDSLVKPIKESYDEVLRRYHGWMACRLFSIMCRFAPNRKELLKIAYPDSSDEAEILRQMEKFQANLFVVVNYLIKFYADHNLETFIVV